MRSFGAPLFFGAAANIFTSLNHMAAHTSGFFSLPAICDAPYAKARRPSMFPADIFTLVHLGNTLGRFCANPTHSAVGSIQFPGEPPSRCS